MQSRMMLGILAESVQSIQTEPARKTSSHLPLISHATINKNNKKKFAIRSATTGRRDAQLGGILILQLNT